MGYQFLNFMYKSHNIITPHLIGRNIEEALTELSSYTLNTRILSQKEDIHVPAGTVLSQIPLPSQHIKPHQTVFLTTAKHPEQKRALNFKNKLLHEVEPFLQRERIRYKKFFIESVGKNNSCIAQIPEAENPISKDGMIFYFSDETSQKVLFPSFEKQSVEDVKEFLNNYGLTPHIFHTSTQSHNHTCRRCTVKEQKPLPGSFVNLKEPFNIQLKVGT